MIYAAPGASFEAIVAGFPTGLTGTARVRILDNVGATPYGPSTAGIAELVAGSGSYAVTLTAPTSAGQFTLLWDTGVVSPGTTAPEDLVVTYSQAAASVALREAVRRLVQDGKPASGPPWNMVKLEDLSDQIPAVATPTQTTFLVRFDSILGGQVTVYAVPGTLVAYRDGSPVPVSPTADVDQNGNFSLPSPPGSRLQVTYGWQMMSDETVDGFVDQARGWLAQPTLDEVPDGLEPALIARAACDVCNAMARKCALADEAAGESSASLSKLADRYQKLAQDFCGQASKMRESYYNPPLETDPAATLVELSIARYDPWR